MEEEAISLAKAGMEKGMERLRRDLSVVRTGRANPAILDHVRVESYGTAMPLNQVANVSVADARMLVVKPFDRGTIAAIEKAINNASLGLNASNDGIVVRVPIPPLTEERRKQLVKQVRDAGEEAKIAVRQARREGNEFLKEAEKDGDVSEDARVSGLEKIQSITDDYVKQVDQLVAKKEADIMGS